MGRGFISRKWKSPEEIPDGNFIKSIPRFQGEAFYDNLKLVDQLDELAEKKNLKTTQLALAWLINLGKHVSRPARPFSPQVIPIPGSSNAGRVKENAQAADVKLTEEDLKGINETLAKFEVKGARYQEHGPSVLMQ